MLPIIHKEFNIPLPPAEHTYTICSTLYLRYTTPSVLCTKQRIE